MCSSLTAYLFSQFIEKAQKRLTDPAYLSMCKYRAVREGGY